MVQPVAGIAAPVEGIDDPVLARVLAAIVEAARDVSHHVRAGALLPAPDPEGARNVHGEVVHPLDILGTERFVEAFDASDAVAGLVCEELAAPKFFEIPNGDPSFLCVLDPIDGTSNADIAITIGSIFGVFPSPDGVPLAGEAPFLRPGTELVTAGYVLYGSSTVLVIATPGLVQEFTLDDTSGEFRLTRPAVRIPDACPYYSVNQGYEDRWDPDVRRAVDVAREGRSLRYVGSLVSDFHRDLVRGGVFLYPADSTSPRGKIRVLYEAAVFAYIAAQAGGAASTGDGPVLDLVPESVHQRTPLFIGNASAVEAIDQALAS
ncbi:MAG: fructose-1,6-bisphosphatase [Chloroflexi bacterium]|nr:fructose-1,6-bisphosphatase [Chloroflexota bacterium]MDA1146735.1 fructose-1,6-bisphosphatase [Chloroflexota bacterium]